MAGGVFWIMSHELGSCLPWDGTRETAPGRPRVVDHGANGLAAAVGHGCEVIDVLVETAGTAVLSCLLSAISSIFTHDIDPLYGPVLSNMKPSTSKLLIVLAATWFVLIACQEQLEKNGSCDATG